LDLARARVVIGEVGRASRRSEGGRQCKRLRQEKEVREQRGVGGVLHLRSLRVSTRQHLSALVSLRQRRGVGEVLHLRSLPLGRRRRRRSAKRKRISQRN
jgi:hypothetical protein